MTASSTKSPRLGNVEPRICNYPVGDEHDGERAVRLSNAAGLRLDPWQALLLQRACARGPARVWSATEVAAIVSRQNGKGGILEAREIAGLFLFGERLILHSAHEFKTASEAFRRVLAVIEGCPDLRRRVAKVTVGHGDEGIELVDGARLRFVARSTGSGRGFSGDLVILDEAYALTPAHIEALMPTLSARPNPQIWYTSSPPLSVESGEQLMSVRRRGLEGEPGLAYFDWGIEGELEDLAGIDLDDRELWRAANPAYGIRISPEFIAKERAAMSDVGFARERLGIWPRDDVAATKAINPEAWANLAVPQPKQGGDVTFAIDVTPDRDHAAIAVYQPLPDGHGNVQIVDHRPGTSWVVGRLAELRDSWHPMAVAVDGKGPAASLLPALRNAGFHEPEKTPRHGDLAVSSASDLAAACGQLVDAVRDGLIQHQGQPELQLAVAGAKTRPLGDAYAWARRTATCDISPLVAATLARWAYVTRADVAGQYDVLESVW